MKLCYDFLKKIFQSKKYIFFKKFIWRKELIFKVKKFLLLTDKIRFFYFIWRKDIFLCNCFFIETNIYLILENSILTRIDILQCIFFSLSIFQFLSNYRHLSKKRKKIFAQIINWIKNIEFVLHKIHILSVK